MKRLIITLLALPLLCTSCWWLSRDEVVDYYPKSEFDHDYKSKLYYTTTDGSLPSNIDPDAFSIDIISMKQENGVGVITFDGILRRIGYRAFENCDNLKSVVVPDSVRIIFNNAFGGCVSLEEVILPDSLMSIEPRTFFNCTSLRSIEIPKRVETIRVDAFLMCDNLEEFRGAHASDDGRTIIIEYDGYIDKKRYIAAFAPYGIEEYTLPDNANTVGEYAFHLCDKLKRVTIPDNYSLIEDSAFAYCSALEEITFGSGIREIRYEALRDCLNLRSIYIKATTPPLLRKSSFATFDYTNYSFTFLGCDVYVPEESVEAYRKAEEWSEFAEYIKGYDFE